MTHFSRVASYEARSERQFGKGLFAAPDDFRLTDSQRGKATVSKFSIGNLIIGEVRSTGHEVVVREPFGATLLVPLNGRLVSETGNETHCAIGNSGALLFSPNTRRTKVIAAKDSDFLAVPVIVPFSEIAETAERMGVSPSKVRRATSFSLEMRNQPRHVTSELTNICMSLYSEIARGSCRLDLSDARSNWSRLIVEKIVEVMDEAEVLSLPCMTRHSTSRQHVNRAMEYMRSNKSDIELIAEVAGACGVSNRTLEHAFKVELGMTPLQVLTTFRLEDARAMLLDRNCDYGVTDVALASGFRHLGRFSRIYRNHFGETPSITRAQR